MGYVKTAEDVKKAFPHGVKCVRDNAMSIELVNLEVGKDDNDTPVLLGWAPPTKDFYIDLDNVLVRKNDWLVFSKGLRISLRPITEAREKQIQGMMD